MLTGLLSGAKIFPVTVTALAAAAHETNANDATTIERTDIDQGERTPFFPDIATSIAGSPRARRMPRSLLLLRGDGTMARWCHRERVVSHLYNSTRRINAR